jgi:hypothetical protein
MSHHLDTAPEELPLTVGSDLAARFHPATFPRALPFTVVQGRVDNSLTCPNRSP